MEKIVVNTAFGHVKIEAEHQSIRRLDLTNEPILSSNSPVLNRAADQIRRYFDGESIAFDLPLNPTGTPFQCAVWQALTEIPYGETRSYQDIAKSIGNIKAVRAVGGAVNKNPIMIVIPCHRVIGKDGSLVGFYGGLDLKQRLLNLEKAGHHE
jgi:methylated-DNA-[protein]-cysteine S-methyltransferase